MNDLERRKSKTATSTQNQSKHYVIKKLIIMYIDIQ